MLDDLVIRAMVTNPHIAKSLRKALSGGRLTEGALKVIYEISQQKITKDPLPSDPVSQWFRPSITKILTSEVHIPGGWNQCPGVTGMSVQVLVEWVSKCSWNHCPGVAGMSV